jgi:acetoin utilization deacetylase AcuC-like enzyme
VVNCYSAAVQEFIDFIANSEEEYSEFVYQELPEEHRGIKFGIDNDCPVFPGLWDFCRLYAGASVGTVFLSLTISSYLIMRVVCTLTSIK